MKSRSFNLLIVLALLLPLLDSAVTATPARANTDAIPVTGSNYKPAAFPANTWSPLPDNGLNNPVSSIVAIGNDLYVGGYFTQTSGGATTGLNYIAKYNILTNTWSPLADNGLNSIVSTLYAVGTDLYVGGFFTQTSGGATTGLNRIAKYDTLTDTWSPLAENGLSGSSVAAVTIIGSNLYVAGNFTQTSTGATTNLNNIARYNTGTNAWSALSENGLNSTSIALAVIGNDLYVGGYFNQTSTNVTAGLNRIARYNTATNTWSALTDSGMNNTVAALTVIGSDLYVGGYFTQTNGGATTGLNRIAKYNTGTNTWSTLTDNGLDEAVFAILPIGSELAIVGQFTQTSSGATTGLNRAAIYDLTSNIWSPLTDNGLNSIVYEVMTVNGDLYIGGVFTQTAGGATTGLNRIARYTVNAPPTVVSHTLNASYNASPNSFTVTFSEEVDNSSGGAGVDDVTNTNNYKIINKGSNGVLETTSCTASIGGDDSVVLPNSVIYSNPTVIINFGTLSVGSYRLFVCGTTSIVDLAGVALAGNGTTSGTDFTFDFTVGTVTSTRTERTSASALPKTGFAPNKTTSLPVQPATLEYASLGDIWLEIPSLNVKSAIVGVPQNKDNTWNVNWLGDETGWLNGTAFPSWEGNSVITAHTTDSNGLPGPFADLKKLKYGNQIIVHMSGQQYIFEVRNSRLARPYTTSFAFEHLEDHSFLTLITCQGYNPLSDSYLFRRVVRAVLVEVK